MEKIINKIKNVVEHGYGEITIKIHEGEITLVDKVKRYK
ncbi:MAG: DUF2292 domain-containing protein [bacterium]